MVREPILKPVPIDELHPTQITVGMEEVRAKRKEWRAKGDDRAGAFLGRHLIPVVLGPKSRSYVIDHHHLARALFDEGGAACPDDAGVRSEPARPGCVLGRARQSRLDAPVRRQRQAARLRGDPANRSRN